MAKKPMITNSDQMTLSSSMVGDIYEKMAQDLMLALIKRIKERGTADLEREPWLWQLEKLNDMHMLNQQNVDYVLKETGIAKKLLDRIIKNEGLKVYQDTSQQLAEQLGANPPHNDVQQALESYAQQTFRDVDNFVNQTLLTTNFGNNATMKVYKSIVEETVAKVVSGVATKDQAICDTVMKWVDKGIPSNFIDKGGHNWNIDTYARTVVQSATYRVYNDMRTRASEELGVDTYYYSIHAASRPACAPIQAKVVTKGHRFHSKELGYTVDSLSDHGWGTPGGALGINCHHYLTPFIVGVNELPDLPGELKNLTEEQAIENGKKQAQQRAYERAVKDDKYKLEAAKILGDEKRIQHFKVKLKTHTQGLNQLIKDNPFLYRDYSRTKIYQTGVANDLVNQIKAQRSSIIGVVSSDGIKVTEVTKHMNERMYERTVDFSGVKDALQNPLVILPDKMSGGDLSRQYIGNYITVNINPTTGALITTWKTGHKRRKKYGGKNEKNND